MDKSNAATPLVFPSDHPADIMNRVASVAAFLELSFSGDHIKPDVNIVMRPDAVAGLAEVLSTMRAAAQKASDMA